MAISYRVTAIVIIKYFDYHYSNRGSARCIKKSEEREKANPEHAKGEQELQAKLKTELVEIEQKIAQQTRGEQP